MTSPGNFWSVYVAGLTLIGIIACMLLLWITARKKIVSSKGQHHGPRLGRRPDRDRQPHARWWMWMFVLTTVFALGYLIPVSGPGQLWQTSWFGLQLGEYQREMDRAREILRPCMPACFHETRGDGWRCRPPSHRRRLFMNNCAQCHGSDAQGVKYFNLTDGDWLHGGTPEKISETLHQGRVGNMPPMAEAVGNADDVRNLSHYVLSLSGSPHDSLRASLGKLQFAACAACHGMDGKGNQALGSP